MISWQELDSLLPQLQCGQCGFGGCKPYAQALVEGKSSPNRCLPGGRPVAESLAARLGVPAGDVPEPPALQSAWIVTDQCIGCQLCLRACPVDAIAGAQQMIHQVVAEYCNGCSLCLPVCPTACISLQPAEGSPSSQQNRQRYQQRQVKAQQKEQQRLLAYKRRTQSVRQVQSVLTACLIKTGVISQTECDEGKKKD